MALYMIVERFPAENLNAIYERLHTKGRGLPEGLRFVESWLSEAGDTVWQIMETDDPATFDINQSVGRPQVDGDVICEIISEFLH